MPEQELQFFVPGIPASQGSMKLWGRSAQGITHDSPRLKPWRESVAAEARVALSKCPRLSTPWPGPIVLAVRYSFYPPPSRQPKGYKPTEMPGVEIYCGQLKHRTKGKLIRLLGVICPEPAKARSVMPDLDKLTRAVGDALEKILYHNDSQIAVILTGKMEI